MRQPRPPRIATYSLFGEADDLPDVVHCESIETRSRLHNWEFAAHRHARLHQVLYLDGGGGHADLEGRTHALPPGTLVNVPMGAVHGFRFDAGTSGLVATLPAETLDQVLHPGDGLQAILARPDVFPADPEIVAGLRGLACAFGGRSFARVQLLRSYVGLLLGRIAQALAPRAATQGSAPPPLLARFEALLDAHFAEHWPVAAYAAELAVTPTHLSRVTRVATGQPASRLIEERIVREARRNLAYTTLPVSAVAYALGFADPAYFSRVFSRSTGMAPRVFRERMATGGQGAAP